MSQVARGAALQAEWNSQMLAWREREPQLAVEWDAAWSGRPLAGVAEALRDSELFAGKDALATRVAGTTAMASAERLARGAYALREPGNARAVVVVTAAERRSARAVRDHPPRRPA